MTQAPNQSADGDTATGDQPARQSAYSLASGTGPDLSVFEDADPVSLATLFETLADPGARYVLTYLLRAEGTVATSQLVEFVVDRTESTMNRSVFRKEVADRLTHSLLPRLDDEGFVQYDVERQLVDRTARTAAALPYLQVALEHRRVQEADGSD